MTARYGKFEHNSFNLQSQQKKCRDRTRVQMCVLFFHYQVLFHKRRALLYVVNKISEKTRFCDYRERYNNRERSIMLRPNRLNLHFMHKYVKKRSEAIDFMNLQFSKSKLLDVFEKNGNSIDVTCGKS